MFVFVGQLILALGAWAHGVSIVETHVVMIFYWGVVMSLIAIHLDRWLAPSAALYFACFLFAAAYPDLRFYAAAAGSFGFAVNALVRWSPETLRETAEERTLARRQRHWAPTIGGGDE